MTISVQQDELGTELQELYLKSKQWISELDFQEDEIKFLKKLFAINCPLLVEHNEFGEIADIMIDVAKIEVNHLRLKKEISDFMKLVSTLVKITDPDIDHKLIQWNTQLETDLNINFRIFRAFKQHVFKMASEVV